MRRRARQGRIRAQATTFILRHETASPAAQGHDTDVIYPQPMGGEAREIDRQEWSRVIRDLLETEAGGNRTRLAELIGVKYLTIKRWIDGTHSVSEESVRLVARAFKLSPIDLLIRVGYYRAGDMQSIPDPPNTEDDELSALIEQANVTPSVKRELHAYVADRRQRYEEALRADVERLLASEQRHRRSA